MHNRNKSILQSVDWITVCLYLVLVIAGWFSICGASYEYNTVGLFDLSGRPGSQMIWIITAFMLVFIILMVDKDFFETFAYIIYGILLLLLIVTIFVAPDIKGSRSWLVMGPLQIQPAEFAKFATALALAKWMNRHNFNLLTFKNFTISTLIILTPMLCIILQKETGSALVFLAFSMVLYREGMSPFLLLAGVCAVIFFVIIMKFEGVMVENTPVGELIVSLLVILISILLIHLFRKNNRLTKTALLLLALALVGGYIASLFTPINYVYLLLAVIGIISLILIFISIKKFLFTYFYIALFALSSVAFLFSVDYVFNNVLEPHQQIRIKVSLGLEDDPSGAGYNVNQSKIAIGSGGLFGKGFLNGTQTKLKYVPEQDTDFIFCTIGEEFGFIGSALILFIYGYLIIRLVLLSERQSFRFGRVYGYSVASIFFFHLIINIGMVIGLIPVIGIPLPFFSYGGSSIWGFTILLFIFLRIDATRKEG